MKRFVLSMAVPVLVLALAGACRRTPPTKEDAGAEPTDSGTAREPSRAAATSRLDEQDFSHPGVICGNKGNCQYLQWRGTTIKESKPQSPYYRGGCLEEVVYVELDPVNGRPPPLSTVFTNPPPPGTSLSAKGYNPRRGHTELTLKTVVDEAFPSMPLFEVLHNQRSLCPADDEDEISEADPRNHRPRRGLAIASRGYWEDGTWKAGGNHFTLSCLTGVVAKCISWGYRPSATSQEEATRYHRACVHAARAKYIADRDISFTCNRTVVDIYDRKRVQTQGNDAGFTFESLWGEDGLICMSHPRWKHCETELDAGGVILNPQCPDPANGGMDWPDGALVAIRSLDSNGVKNKKDEDRCPTADDALCLGCRPAP
jgi:hypothetical protein